MRLFAYYLPQFHEIPENNNWWGEGFTEWTNVKAATPLFKGHRQPLVPLNNNYYNLLNKSTVEWQTELLDKYNVDGLIYYHYYFNGKLLLEKPAENLLRWKNINQRFFFCWANHPWIRSWEGKSEVIMPLVYGDEEDWEAHFNYLLPFFKDSRYEKKDNKPLFCIFKSDFSEKNPMMAYFDKRCKDEGFNGIYLIETYSGEKPYKKFIDNLSHTTSRIVFREPAIQIANWNATPKSFIFRGLRKISRLLKIDRKPTIYSGDSLIIQKINNFSNNEVEIPCVWFEWDNTPRHKQRGYVILPYLKQRFFEYLDLISDKDYLFINAWNEWAEGMILEPTQDHGYKYLEWIKEWRGK